MKIVTILIFIISPYFVFSQTPCECKETPALSKQLYSIGESDQHNRRLMYNANANTDSLWKLQVPIDNANVLALKNLFDKYEFCCLISINKQAVESVLAHTPNDIRENFFLPILFNSIMKGNGDPYMYANLTDQMLVFSNKKQRYGMIACKGNPEVLSELCPIEDLENLNKRRKAIGLNSIEEQCKERNQINPLIK